MQDQNNDSKEEEDLFFSRVMEYTNSKLQHQTQGNQIFFRSFSTSPNRFSQREKLNNQQSWRNFIPSSSAQTGGFFTTRQNDKKRNYIDHLISSQKSIEYLQKEEQPISSSNKISARDQDKVNIYSKESEKNTNSFPIQQQLLPNKNLQEDSNSVNINDQKLFLKNQKQIGSQGQQETNFAQKIQDYTQELKELIKGVQENNSIETVHNKLIREMIHKQFKNIEAIPIQNYYESIQEFKEYFQNQLHDIQKCILQINNQNKQIKLYEDKLKAFAEDSNIQNTFQENVLQNDYNSFNSQENLQLHSFNPNNQQTIQQFQNINSKDENQNNLQDSISKGYINSLNIISKQLSQQVDKLLIQLQKQFEQKDEEIEFLLEQQSIERQDYQRQVELKQEEINIILQNHNHLSNIYREKVQSLEQTNESLQNRIEDILFLSQKREMSMQEEVNQLRDVAKTLEKCLQLPVNSQKLQKNEFIDNVCCSKCGSTQIIYLQKMNLLENEYQSESFSERKNQKNEGKQQDQLRQPLILNQSYFENGLVNHLELNTTSTDDNSAKKSKQSRSIFLKKSQTPSNALKKQFFIDSSQSDKKEKGDKTFQTNYQEIQTYQNNIQNVGEHQKEQQQQGNTQFITYSELQKQFQELKMTPFNIKIDILNEYFTKIYNCLQSGIYQKNNSNYLDQIKEFAMQFNDQVLNLYQKLSLFSDLFDTKIKSFNLKVEQFENLTQHQKVVKQQNPSLQSLQQIRQQSNQDQNNSSISKEEFNLFLKDKISQKIPFVQQTNPFILQIEKFLTESNHTIEAFIQEYSGQAKEVKLPNQLIFKLQKNIEKLYQVNQKFGVNQNNIDQDSNPNQFDNQNSLQISVNDIFNQDRNGILLQDEKQQNIYYCKAQFLHPFKQQRQDSSNFYQIQNVNQQIKLNEKVAENLQMKNEGGNNANFLNNISFQTSQQSSNQLANVSKEKSIYSDNYSISSPNKKSKIFKQSNNKIIQNKIIREGQQIEQEIYQLVNIQFQSIQQECKQVFDQIKDKYALFTQQQSSFDDFSQFSTILQQILEELKLCKSNDQKRYSLDAKVNEAIMKENSIMKNQLQEQKEYYDKELESAVQNLILHQEFFEERKKIYEDMNQQYKASIQLLNSEIKRRNNQIINNFDQLNDNLIQIQNSIKSIMRIEKNILISSSKENNGAFLAVEGVKNEIQNCFSIQNKKLNSFIQMKKKILDKFNRIEAHENLITQYKLKGKLEQLQQNIQRFEKQNDFLEVKLTEEKKGCKYLIRMQQQYYETLCNYLSSNPNNNNNYNNNNNKINF